MGGGLKNRRFEKEGIGTTGLKNRRFEKEGKGTTGLENEEKRINIE